jgi:hypothetical protein
MSEEAEPRVADEQEKKDVGDGAEVDEVGPSSPAMGAARIPD